MSHSFATRASQRWLSTSRQIVPLLLVLSLTTPVLSFVYIGDDFEFLNRVARLEASELLPDPNTLFYRPVSRELYFSLLYHLGPDRPLWGHLLNAGLLLLVTWLLASLAAKLIGERGGLFAGMLFAVGGTQPVLVAWASAAQDLLSMAFVLVALHFQLRGRRGGAVVAAALGLLSKETTAVLLPALILLRPLAGLGRNGLRRDLLAFGALAATWAAVHPGIRQLLVNRLESSGASGGYVSVSAATIGTSLVNSAATLANLPLVGSDVRWPDQLTPFFIVALLIGAVGVWISGVAPREPGGGKAARRSGIFALAVALSLPPVLLAAALLRYWMPYYVCVASLGTSLAIGALLSCARRWAALAILTVALIAGVWSRGQSISSEVDVPTEGSLGRSSEELHRLEVGIRSVLPDLRAAPRADCLIQTASVGTAYFHLFRFQVLRFWYRNLRIDALHPELRRPNPLQEYLLFVADDQTVYRIDPVTMRVQASKPDPAPIPVNSVLRAYGQGLAVSGDPDRALALLLSLREENPSVANLNRRLAASYLLAAGRTQEARSLLASLPVFSRMDALEVAAGTLSNPSRQDLDRPTMIAMGIDPNDPTAVRAIMRLLMQNGSSSSGARFAGTLLALVPGDAEARAVLEYEAKIRRERVMARAVPDSLW